MDNRPPRRKDAHTVFRVTPVRAASPAVVAGTREGTIGGAFVRIALLTEGGYPYAGGESVVWCDRLLRGLPGHEYEVYALSRSPRQAGAGWCELPDNVARVHTAPLWGAFDGGGSTVPGVPNGRAAARTSGTLRGPRAPRTPLTRRRSGAAGGARVARSSREAGAAVRRAHAAYGRRDRRRFGECFRALAEAICLAGPQPLDAPEERAADLTDRFATGLYGLAELARERGGLPAALRSEQAVRILQSTCRAPGALRAVRGAQVADLLAAAERLERALRPLSLDWYGDGDGARVRGVRATGARAVGVRGAGVRGAAGVAGTGAYADFASGAGSARGGGAHPGLSGAGLSGADLCHAVGGGVAALPGLLARRAFGTPLLITEYGVRLREHYLAGADGVPPAAAGAPVRALLASFQRRLAQEAYAQAELITPGDARARRWQERCGARREQLRTVYPGMDATPFADLGEESVLRAHRGAYPEAPRDGVSGRSGGGGGRGGRAPTLVWVGRVEPTKDLIGLLHAFAEVRRRLPGARLRVVGTPPVRGPEEGDYEARCWALAAQLFPCEAADAVTVGESPVSFEELGGPGVPTPADAYAAGAVVVLSSVVESFPVSLVEAMFCGKATVSTDVGAVYEVVGGTGLVVPPRNPGALADSCVALLRDPARRARLGAAARARALELFTVEQNVSAFRGIYLELMSNSTARAGSSAGLAGGVGGAKGAMGAKGATGVGGAQGAKWADGARRGRAKGAVEAGRRPLPFAFPPEDRLRDREFDTEAEGGEGREAEARATPGAAGRARASVPSWARPDPAPPGPVPVVAPVPMAPSGEAEVQQPERREGDIG